MGVESLTAAVRAAARGVDVPGAPRSLRLDDVTVVDRGGDAERVLLSWSFVDPVSYQGDRRPHGRRLRGVSEARVVAGASDEQARTWWAAAQLDAAHRFVLQVDGDWLPGEPSVALSWTTEEAWAALVRFLSQNGAAVVAEAGGLRVEDPHETITYRIDPGSWAAYLNGPELVGAPEDDDPEDAAEPGIVPAAFPVLDGLPLWTVDELSEAAGCTHSGVIGLVDGRLVDLEP